MSSVIDKKNIFSQPLPDSMFLELGCGDHKKNPAALGVDQLDFSCVDLVGDVFDVLEKFPDQCIDGISSFHFVEHVGDLSKLIHAFDRVLKRGGILEITVPHFSNPYFYSDPTHKNHFGLYTFCYFTTQHPFSRTVPTYGMDRALNIVSVDLIFKSPKPFYVRYAFKKSLGWIFNSSNFMREFWEENLCYIFPCYELTYKIQAV